MSRSGATPINSASKGKRNLIINGDMVISQRGSILAGTASFQYLLDRHVGWFPNVASVTSPNLVTASSPASFPGVRAQADSKSFRMTGTINSLSPSPTYARQQRIEAFRLKDIKSNVISIGFWSWCNNMQDCTIQVIEPTGGGDDNWGSSAVVYTSSPLPVTDSAWQFFKVENIPISSAKNGLEIRYSFSNPLATVLTESYVTELMVNEGEFIEPFQLMGNDFQEELRLCQRYFEKSYNLDVAPGSIDSGGARAGFLNGSYIRETIAYQVEKRIDTAVISIYDTTAGTIGVVRNENATTTAVAVGYNGTHAFNISSNAGAVGQNFHYHWTSDAEL